jgi:flagellar protein FlaG
LIGLNGTWPTQAATGNPSPPLVVVKPSAPVQAVAPQPEAKVETSRPAVKQVSAPADAVKAAAEQIESYLRSSGRALEFRVDGNTGRTVVSVRNPQTGELIRQIPGEETLRLADMLGNGGSLIDIAV